MKPIYFLILCSVILLFSSLLLAKESKSINEPFAEEPESIIPVDNKTTAEPDAEEPEYIVNADSSLSANPNPCILKTGSSKCTSQITWSTSGFSNLKINYTSGSGVKEYFFANASSGKKNATWITATGYKFKLYSGRTLLKNITVKGQRVITATPCACVPDLAVCSTTISWSVPSYYSNITIYTRQGSVKKVFAKGQSGKKSASGITNSGLYFDVYSGNILIDTLLVKGNCTACSPTTPKDIRVLILSYIPVNNGQVNTSITGELPTGTSLSALRNHIGKVTNKTAYVLTNGSIYHGYKDSSATPYLKYNIFEKKEFLTPIPPLYPWKSLFDNNPESGKWAPQSPFIGDYLIVDFGKEIDINYTKLYFWFIDRPQKFHIFASLTGAFNGEQATIVNELDSLANQGTTNGYTALPNSAIEWKKYTFKTVRARYLKLVIDKYRTETEDGQVNLYEFEIGKGNGRISIPYAYASSNEGFTDQTLNADHTKILNSIRICNYVENLSVKEVWIWMYHTDKIGPIESYQKGPGHELGNGYMELPLCKKSYTVYDYNYGRDVGEAVEDHTHHIERVLDYVDHHVYWDLFTAGSTEFLVNNKKIFYTNKSAVYRCGWTHCPPNVIISKCPATRDENPDAWDENRCFCDGYNWFSERIVQSDCEDWKPDGYGKLKNLSCHTWTKSTTGDCYNYIDYLKDGNIMFKMWWMQNIPGRCNTMTYQGKKMRNWWEFIGDFDKAIAQGRSFVLP